VKIWRFLFPILALTPLQADTLDWDVVNWTDTTTPYSQTFTVGSNTVTVAITGQTGDFIPIGGDTSPDDNTHQTGGLTGQQSLYLAVNHDQRSDVITVTVTFSTFVNNVSFSLFDIDFSSGDFADQIRNISGTDGTNTYAASISNTGSTSNTIANNNTLTATVTGDDTATEGTSEGNATFTFSQNVNSITFTYGNAGTAPTDPNQQSIGLGDVTYTVVPEPSTYVTGLLFIGLLSVQQFRVRRQRIGKSSS
jgi:hypothetical protein